MEQTELLLKLNELCVDLHDEETFEGYITATRIQQLINELQEIVTKGVNNDND